MFKVGDKVAVTSGCWWSGETGTVEEVDGNAVQVSIGGYLIPFKADELGYLVLANTPPPPPVVEQFASTKEPGIPHTAEARKQTPVATGVLAYFPDAIAEVAKVSYIGGAQHNPGKPLFWDRPKSADQMDAAVRHIMDYLAGGYRDVKGNLLLAQAAWRLLAQAQLDLEDEMEVL